MGLAPGRVFSAEFLLGPHRTEPWLFGLFVLLRPYSTTATSCNTTQSDLPFDLPLCEELDETFGVDPLIIWIIIVSVLVCCLCTCTVLFCKRKKSKGVDADGEDSFKQAKSGKSGAKEPSYVHPEPPMIEDQFDEYVEQNTFARKDAEMMPAGDLFECQHVCVDKGYGGFVIWRGNAYFKAALPEELEKNLRRDREATSYIVREFRC